MNTEPVCVDLSFRLAVPSAILPRQSVYHLFGALCTLLDDRPDPLVSLRFVSTKTMGDNNLLFTPQSRLFIRTPLSDVSTYINLVGKGLKLERNFISLGAAEIYPIVPTPNLSSSLVTFKNATTPHLFLQKSRNALRQLNIDQEPTLPCFTRGPLMGQPRKGRIALKTIRDIGYALEIHGLTDEQSIRLQTLGIGGRRHLGCGVFIPQRSAPPR